jgi:hypothetical protein
MSTLPGLLTLERRWVIVLVLSEIPLIADLGLTLVEFVALGFWLDGRNMFLSQSLLRGSWEETDWLSLLCPALGWTCLPTGRGCGPEEGESEALVMIVGVLIAVAPTVV